MRVHVGPGYRVYFAQRHATVLLLLCGDDKSSQARDMSVPSPRAPSPATTRS